MTLATVHDHLQAKCPDGAGFAIHFSVVEKLLGKTLHNIAADPALSTDLPLAVTNRVNFSFFLNEKSVELKQDWTLSMKLDVVIHLPSNVAAEIVRVSYELADVPINGGFDRGRDECFWKAAAPNAINKTAEQWEQAPALNLIAAGFVDAAGAADKQRFLEEVFYGFVWINKTNLLDTILRAVPFPQVQRFLGPIQLAGLLQSEVIDQHLAVWTDEVNVLGQCGGGVLPKTGVATSWSAQGASAVKSPWDGREPALGLYIGATTLLDWHAGYLAPAIAFRKSGGGFVRYDVDGALSLQRLALVLRIDPNGGSLELDAGLHLLAYADSFIDGPCGSRLSLLSATIQADASARAVIGVHFEQKALALVLDIDIQADVDRNSVNIVSGGLLGGIIGELTEALYKVGIVNIDTTYRKRTQVDLLNLSDFSDYFMRGATRVSDHSVFYPITQGEG